MRLRLIAEWDTNVLCLHDLGFAYIYGYEKINCRVDEGGKNDREWKTVDVHQWNGFAWQIRGKFEKIDNYEG